MKTYVVEAYKELTQKVTWPEWGTLFNSAILVMIASAVIAAVILTMDLSFENIMKAIYRILYKL